MDEVAFSDFRCLVAAANIKEPNLKLETEFNFQLLKSIILFQQQSLNLFRCDPVSVGLRSGTGTLSNS